MAKSYNEIVKFQTALLNGGFNPGTIDGRWGANTRGAMNAYQGAIGMAPTNLPDDLTITTLNSEAPGRESPPIIVSLKSLLSAINQQAKEGSGLTTTGGDDEVVYPSETNGTPTLDEGWSMPWWGWGLIGLGVVGVVVGGVWAWKRYKKKGGKKGFGDPEEGMTCTVGLSRQEKTFPKFVWGSPVKEAKKKRARSRRRERPEVEDDDNNDDIIDVEAEEIE